MTGHVAPTVTASTSPRLWEGMSAATSNYSGKMKMSRMDDPRFWAVLNEIVDEQGYASIFDVLMVLEAIASTDMEK